MLPSRWECLPEIAAVRTYGTFQDDMRNRSVTVRSSACGDDCQTVRDPPSAHFFRDMPTPLQTNLVVKALV